MSKSMPPQLLKLSTFKIPITVFPQVIPTQVSISLEFVLAHQFSPQINRPLNFGYEILGSPGRVHIDYDKMVG
jgi:hypothetical protein